MNNDWFWHNSFMSWFEGKLLTFTNWFWRKRHEPKPKVHEIKEEQPEKVKAKKTPAKKTPAKKTNWNVKS